MTKQLFSFFLVMTLGLLFLFLVQHTTYSYVSDFQFNSSIVLPYILNFVVAIAIMFFLSILEKRLFDILAFLFLGGSLLKFSVFFTFLYPIYLEDGVVNWKELTSFMIPYAFCLLIEVKYLSKILNK